MANIYARGSTVHLTVPGRRTGQPRSLPLNLLIEDSRRYLVAVYGEVGWVQNVRAAGGRAGITSGGRTENVRLQQVQPAAASSLLKKYIETYPIVARFFDAKPGDSVERFAADTDKKPVFEILPG